jgi:hypothetical protein
VAVLGGGQPEWTPLIGYVDEYSRPGSAGLPASIVDAAEQYGWGSGDADIAYRRELDITVAASRQRIHRRTNDGTGQPYRYRRGSS